MPAALERATVLRKMPPEGKRRFCGLQNTFQALALLGGIKKAATKSRGPLKTTSHYGTAAYTVASHFVPAVFTM
jgi:hypothetical protein